MKNRILMALCLAVFSCCDKTEPNENPSLTLEGLTFDNFPKMSCSTSTRPLQTLLACKLLNIEYQWYQNLALNGTWHLVPIRSKLTDAQQRFFEEKLQCPTTHGAFTRLIDGETELIIASRSISRDEKAYADEKGVRLIEKPIALDALVFIVNPANPVRSLTTEQIQNIYTGKVTRWSDVGGKVTDIHPYMRNPNSGSQEKMETLVMKGLTMQKWPEMIGGSMLSPFHSILSDADGIGYTVYYYYDRIVRQPAQYPTVAVDGTAPSHESIRMQKYPYTTYVYAAIRADTHKASMAYKMFELLSSKAARKVIDESGYIAVP
ncbi:PstS family phosphate ABC transporter substrate-binding protein [Tannerella sp.]|uniref:PstS family phosphate ABC transporter substrate-binding protein n=1 Tax=Tannerella sp. TaxID=2382127 RepID=UPI0026DCC859|nr:substrate-binding domain-containing protein [Tannerella sp.]MDO4704414.1 substrate-binding domain-containing protein [Tannerella sp.]